MDSSAALQALDEALDAARRALEDSDVDASIHVGICLVRIEELDQMAHRGAGESTRFLVDEIVERLADAARTDDQVLQIREDEFCVVFRNLANQQYAELAAGKIYRELRKPVMLLGERIYLTPRMGIAVCDEAAESTTALFQRAFAALKTTIEMREAYRFGNVHPHQSVHGKVLDAELSVALAAGEFVLYFQPKVHAQFDNVVGAEALIRWHSKSRGVVTPDSFIPMVEGSQLAKPFTSFVTKSAIAAVADWPESLGVAINVPPSVLHDDEIVHVTDDALQIHGVDGARFTIEVTERGMFADIERAFDTLQKLRSIGVRVSIDDFGTGQSSLSNFRNIPADEVKVDKSFVEGMAAEPGGPDALIVKAITDLAHTFSLTVVAEGVQTNEARQALRALGCDILQGYGIAKPMPEGDFQSWVLKRMGRHVGPSTRRSERASRPAL